MRGSSGIILRSTACVLLATIAWSLVLAHSDPLHELVHGDPTQPQHQCAATIFQGGALEAAPEVQTAAACILAPAEVLKSVDHAFASAPAFTSGGDRGPPSHAPRKLLFG